jgi:hypothetical protein
MRVGGRRTRDESLRRSGRDERLSSAPDVFEVGDVRRCPVHGVEQVVELHGGSVTDAQHVPSLGHGVDRVQRAGEPRFEA